MSIVGWEWLDTLADNLADVEGIKQVHTPDQLPGAILSPPQIIILPVDGTFTGGSQSTSLHNLRLTLFLAPQVLPVAYATAVDLIKPIRAAIYGDITLGGAVQYCQAPEETNFYEGPGQINYNGTNYIGINFYVTVKENESVEVA